MVLYIESMRIMNFIADLKRRDVIRTTGNHHAARFSAPAKKIEFPQEMS